MISKELISAIKGLDVQELKEISNGMVYYTYKDTPDGCVIHGRDNLSELMVEVKKWALDRDCTINSFIDFDGTAFAKVFNCVLLKTVSFSQLNEPYAVFKAGNFILSQQTTGENDVI